MRILILDDDEERHMGFKLALENEDRVHVHNFAEAIVALAGKPFDVVYLDHDLGDSRRTGFDVAKAITGLEKNRRPKMVVIHSWNTVGAVMMEHVLHRAGIPVSRVPFKLETLQ